MKRFVALMLILILSLSVLTGCSDTTGTEPDTTAAETTGEVNTEVTAQQAEDTTLAESEAVSQTEADTTAQVTLGDIAGQTLADTDEFAIIITHCVTDSEQGFVMNAYLENKTDDPVVFKITASALNNKDMHPAFTQEVKAGESMVAPMVWSADKLRERRVTQVTEAKIELQVVSYGESIKMLSSDIYVINP
ncbi:MAG: hypothetical protein IJ298_09780 [Ruminococcus sp.]|nr:hypothetical protein [Ruminococcus sp.]